MKHNTRVTVANLGNGDIAWTTPAGKIHITHPENRLGATRTEIDEALHEKQRKDTAENPPTPDWNHPGDYGPTPF
jgi:hypothetical protein